MTTHEMTLQELRDILLECAGAEEGIDLAGDIADRGFDELGYDSLALLEMAAKIEQTREVRIPDDAVSGLRTPRSVLDLVNSEAAAVPAVSAAAAAATPGADR
ncbi:phosphopantetheine-binding [Catenulispora acidiphila DSM 44928]|uniref:Phosphopantetheine-binding n=1 Tax=Catenulispora acidiphila (strain DSM 44928 / JCM 14897 / NBRC 102108 / NRRL B-24433 / ID139908) TaxID=479433 RepID=C7PWQ7_CATAD|nr:acyl carrier protein [Catenulispora acidiphila]ACU75337.1 phosphopantetheine-binding [Catenulispora acidiphila DSM 44928]